METQIILEVFQLLPLLFGLSNWGHQLKMDHKIILRDMWTPLSCVG